MSRCKRAFAIGCLLLLPVPALAQTIDSDRRETPATGERRSEPLLQQALRLSTPPMDPWGRSRSGSTPLLAARSWEQEQRNDQVQARQGKRSARRIVFGAIVGAAGGLFAGGYTGAWIEGDRCHCDDPGLMGALIGAPVGAAVGGVLGGLFLF